MICIKYQCKDISSCYLYIDSEQQKDVHRKLRQNDRWKRVTLQTLKVALRGVEFFKAKSICRGKEEEISVGGNCFLYRYSKGIPKTSKILNYIVV